MSFYHDFDEEKKVLEHRIRLYDNPVNDFYKLNVICFLSTYNSKYLNEEIINLLYYKSNQLVILYSIGEHINQITNIVKMNETLLNLIIKYLDKYITRSYRNFIDISELRGLMIRGSEIDNISFDNLNHYQKEFYFIM
jgi:hypothetical protein